MIARQAAGFAAGILFGVGLTISGMISPAKVLAFLDVAGAWDPSLALVMAGALFATFIGYRLVLRRPAPLLAPSFSLPTGRAIDGRLIAGAAMFGAGWGLAGFCPGPAIAALVTGSLKAAAFVVAMAIGMRLHQLFAAWLTRRRLPDAGGAGTATDG